MCCLKVGKVGKCYERFEKLPLKASKLKRKPIISDIHFVLPLVTY